LEHGGFAFVKGKPWKSEAVKRILHDDPEAVMPPPESNLSLSEKEKALIIKWVEQGAKWKEHWAFTKPEKKPLPEIADQMWPQNEIDYFVLKRLEAEGLEPAAQAGKTTWLRRVYLDLTGLPPREEEIDAFLADEDPRAFEKIVDRLLASPHYGERLALDWLDLARYADSHGYQDDGMRNTWPWRDWVIEAFNDNMPYDQFVTWQLAGDLMENPSKEQLLATCFNRNHPQTQEGGVVDEEYRVEYVADRTNTFGKAFLGLTMRCARCHDHKYDPISQKDYYSLFAFFNNNNDAGIVPYNGEASPTVILPSEEAEEQLQALSAQIDSLEKELLPEKYIQDFQSWLQETTKKTIAFSEDAPELLADFDFEREEEVPVRTIYLDKKPRPKKYNSRKDSTIAYFNKAKQRLDANVWGHKDDRVVFVVGKNGKGIRFMGDAGIRFNRDLDFDRHQPFTLSIWVKLLKAVESGPIFGKTNGDFEGYRGWLCKLNDDGTLSFQFNHVWPDNCIDFQTIDTLPVGEWTHLALTYNGSSKAEGIEILINGKSPGLTLHKDNLRKSLLHGANETNWSNLPFLLGMELRKSIENMVMDELKVYNRQLSDLEIQCLFRGVDLINPRLQEADEKDDQLLKTYLLSGANKKYNERLKAITEIRKEENLLLTDQPAVMIMQERTIPRTTYMLDRGAYDAPTKPVDPETPIHLPAFSEELPKNRLGLSRWLTAPDNPLTARVVVNRLWAICFGKGIVETQEDFGSQGKLPSHPELLDWLAVDFMESGWDIKAFMKKLVLSATYRQSSVPSQDLSVKDPRNEWLSYYPPHRLPSELIRDNALAASGLLVREIGGPSVYPYQPKGIWKALATRNAIEYQQQQGDSLYRRSIYTIWKRSSPPPSMMSFDAPDRYSCTVRRQKTATPLQSLVLMNDPQFVEAARVLAERMLKATGEQIETKIQYAFKQLIGRSPRVEELDVLKSLYEEEVENFQKDEKRTDEWLSIGEYPVDESLDQVELASCTVVVSTIMNFEEFVIKR